MPSLASFKAYLEHCHFYPENQDRVMHAIEHDVIRLLREYVCPDFGTLVDGLRDSNFYADASSQLLSNESCIQKESNDNRLWCSRALKHWSNYLAQEQSKSGLGSTRKKHSHKKGQALSAPEVPVIPELTEGDLKEMHIVGRERNPEARKQCIAYYRERHDGHLLCECCGFEFGKVYGDLGSTYIEVHHLSPISHQDESHPIDPKSDLVPLCANCHAMIHRLLAHGEPEGLDSLVHLQEIVKGGKQTDDQQ